MVAITIISVSNFLQFVYASVLVPSIKLEKNFKFYALITKGPDVLFIISLIIWGSQANKRFIPLLYNLLVSRR